MAKKHEPTEATSTALMEAPPPVSAYPILSKPAEEIRALMGANLGSGGMTAFDLDRIKIPAAGGQFWTVNTLSGEEQKKDITGVILLWKEPRAYWSLPLEQTGGSTPPDCVSEDSLIGRGNPGGKCEPCPLSQWGSDPKGGKGQACKQKRLLFFLRPGNMLPDAIFLPPSSIKPIKQFFLRLASQGVPFYAVETTLALDKVKNAGGIVYSVVTAKMARRLEREEALQIKGYADAIAPSLEKAARGAQAEDFAE